MDRARKTERKKNTKNKKPCSFVCPQKQLLFGLIDILLSSFSRIKPQANTPSFLHVKVVITSERNSDIAFRMPRRLSCRSEFILFRSCASEFVHITPPEMPCQREVTRVSTPEREFHSGTKSRNSIMYMKNNHSSRYTSNRPLSGLKRVAHAQIYTIDSKMASQPRNPVGRGMKGKSICSSQNAKRS